MRPRRGKRINLNTRLCNGILIAVTDGLKGMSEVLSVVYPAITLQTCIVHLMRISRATRRRPS